MKKKEKSSIYRLSLLQLLHVFIHDYSTEPVSKCAVSMLVAKQMTNAEKHLHFFKVVTKLWLSQVGSRHWKIWYGTPVTLQGTPRQLYLPLCLKTWMGTEEKRGQKSQKTGGRHSGSHTVLLMLTSLQTSLPTGAFEDLFGWRYASMGCLRPAAGAELSWWVLTSLSILLPRAWPRLPDCS